MATTRKTKQAEILREYGPYPGIDHVHGVTFDGAHVWFARGESIVALDPGGGAVVRELPVAAEAGTAFDGKYLWQLAGGRIRTLFRPQVGNRRKVNQARKALPETSRDRLAEWRSDPPSPRWWRIKASGSS